MTEPAGRPVLFLAFANDREDEAQYLRNLPEELRGIRERLEVAEAAGLCELVVRANTTIAELLDILQDRRYSDRIAVFHYGGHADGFELLLESAEGRPDVVHARGLAGLLGGLRSIRLVFLNGCATEAQVENLLAAGVPAVVATAGSIADDVATELAVRFYAALAGGAALVAAYDQAVAAVRTGYGDDAKDLHRLPEASDGRWPWQLYLGGSAELARDWNLPAASGDPLYGLPRPPERDLPESPYRHLQWFREADAEIFFGRGREIRQFHELVSSPSSAPILLFYGQSGVGKSSLLAAGVIPRLVATHEIRYARRERTGGLTGTLRDALGVAPTGSVRDAWHALEKQTGRPLVVVLDQVEEAYTRRNSPDELDAFVAMLAEIFATRTDRPRGRMVLSFRKEWLADLEQRLRGAGLPRSKSFLDRLDREGIIEIVEGPARSERLRLHYGLLIEPGLAAIIADDLLEDPNAVVAPTLEILLTKMWTQARKRAADSPLFDRDLYQDLRRRGLLLRDFVSEQLNALRAWNASVIESGLALDVLAFHTTSLGTAEYRTRAEIEAAYAHWRDSVARLLERCEELHLVTRLNREPASEEEAGSRLSHDTLAPLVRQRFDESDFPGQRARRILDGRVGEWREQRAGTPLDESDLATVEAGAAGTRAWTDDEGRIVAASRRRRARRRWARGGLVAAATVSVVLILNQTGTARLRASESQSRALAAVARQVPEVDHAVLVAVEALRTADTFEARDALLARLNQPNPRLRRTFPVGAEVGAVAVSPDGAVIAAGTSEHVIHLRDATTGIPLRDPLTGHTNSIVGLAFSADGAMLVSAGFEGEVRLWNTRTWQPIGTPLAHADPVLDIAFDPRGDILVTGDFRGVVRFWNVGTQQPARDSLVVGVGTASSVSIGPDGATLAVVVGYQARLWNLNTQQPISAPLEVDGQVFAAALSPDGSTMAFGGGGFGGGSVRLVDVADGQLLGEPLVGHVTHVETLAFSSDGLLASGSNDGTVRLWDVESRRQWGDPLAANAGGIAFHSGVRDLAFTPDASMLVSGSTDGSVRLWELKPWQPSGDTISTSQVRAVAFSPDGATVLASGLPQLVTRWGVTTGAEAGASLRTLGYPHAIAFSPDGAMIASTSSEEVQLSNAADGSLIARLEGHAEQVYGLDFSPDGRLLASASRDETVRLWDVATRSPVLEPLEGHTDDILAVTFSPDGRLLASAGEDASVRFWDVATGQPLGGFYGHRGTVRSVAFSPDGALFASGGDDGVVGLWRLQPLPNPGDTAGADIIDVEPVGESLIGHQNAVSSVTFSPDGTVLATGSYDWSVRLWNIERQQALGEPFQARMGAINSIAFSPDGAMLAAGADGGVMLWSVTLDAWIGSSCRIAGRNLPALLWSRLVQDRPYACTCPALAPGEGSDTSACR